MARYKVMAKRKNTNERWTEWRDADTYNSAKEGTNHVERCGFVPKIFIKDEAVEKVWAILEGDGTTTEKTDAILDIKDKAVAEATRKMAENILKDILVAFEGECENKIATDIKKMFKRKYGIAPKGESK